MLGISYGEVFVIIGAAAVLIGPKDLPIMARTAGRFAGRAIGYVQMARGQFDSVMQQSQVSQVHKELQDTIAQLDAIRSEIRGISIMNPGPLTRRLEGVGPNIGATEKPNGEFNSAATTPKDMNSISSDLHSRAMTYAKLAGAPSVKSSTSKGDGNVEKLNEDLGLLNILPISAESAGLLRQHNDESKGSDIVLEAILEAEVAHNAKHFFSQPENQIPKE